jgi:hypothetical protein
MIIPQIHGQFKKNDFFIYGACDKDYFDEFGTILINSIRQNSKQNVHLHLFNPRDDQIQFCHNNNVSVTYEYVPIELFKEAASRWYVVPTDILEKSRYDRILGSMEKSGDKSILERMQKTYFACARFIRLSEIIESNQSLFSMDVDAIFRKDLPKLRSLDNIDFFIRKNKQYLAGGIYLTGNDTSLQFLKEYGNILRSSIEKDYIYWSLDQDTLDDLVPKYKTKELPISFIDWYMKHDSYIWTAKGKRKELEIFIEEQKKYKS